MIIYVNSFEEAKSYTVLFNTSEILLDNNRAVFYVKTVDGQSQYTIHTQKFEHIEHERTLDADYFETKQHFYDQSSKLYQMNDMMDSTPFNVMNQGCNNVRLQFTDQQSVQRSARSK